MSKYAELDQEILRLIKNGCVEFWSIHRRVADMCKPLVTEPSENFRALDRRLQALRKAGRIEYSRSNKRWSICTGISISAKQVGFEK